jgi:hypothetical protein
MIIAKIANFARPTLKSSLNAAWPLSISATGDISELSNALIIRAPKIRYRIK